MQLVRSVLLAAHVLAGAAWFGAMLYSLVVLHPRAKSFFRNPAQFEDFIATLAAGARWKVLGGCMFIALTGGILLLLREPGQSIAFGGCFAREGLPVHGRRRVVLLQRRGKPNQAA
jgi:hypothetical protein